MLTSQNRRKYPITSRTWFLSGVAVMARSMSFLRPLTNIDVTLSGFLQAWASSRITSPNLTRRTASAMRRRRPRHSKVHLSGTEGRDFSSRRSFTVKRLWSIGAGGRSSGRGIGGFLPCCPPLRGLLTSASASFRMWLCKGAVRPVLVLINTEPFKLLAILVFATPRVRREIPVAYVSVLDPSTDRIPV